jgi:5'-nucleotidase
MDPMVLLEISGDALLEALENGVSQYPKLEGRFPQVLPNSASFNSWIEALDKLLLISSRIIKIIVIIRCITLFKSDT